MDKIRALQAIDFAAEANDETLCIGGGEPTLHPDFFEILRYALDNFNHVYMVTNGSQTSTMRRLSDIIFDSDCENCECSDEDLMNGICTCYENRIANIEGKLTVALSIDFYHEPIETKISDLWWAHARAGDSGFEIRNVGNSFQGVVNQGRAALNGVGQSDGCICPDIFIHINGNLTPCGCSGAPIIGNIWEGFTPRGCALLEDETFQDKRCWKPLKGKHLKY